MKNIIVKDRIINITGISDEDYISLTDIARIKNDEDTNIRTRLVGDHHRREGRRRNGLLCDAGGRG